MTGNVNFPSPDVSLATITALVNDFEIKHLAAQGGGVAQTQAQDEAELVLDNNMRILANYVTRIADGDTVKITSAGFAPSKTELSPENPPAKTENLQLTQSLEAGTIHIQCDKVENAKGYITIVTDNPSPSVSVNEDMVVLLVPPANPSQYIYITQASTSRKSIISGLKSGSRYYVKKYAFNARGKGADSATVSIFAP